MNKLLLAYFVLVLFVLIFVFILSIRSYYSHNHPLLNEIRSNFSKISPEYAKIPLREGDSAYTENKSSITLCLRDPETKQYYDMNTLMYVALHELAHMISKSTGHNDEFKDNFSNLLKRATSLGLYNPFKPIPKTYCGINNDYNSH